jgi:hypothetical protein
VPEDDRPSATPRSFTQSLRAIHADVGGPILWLALISAIALFSWAIARGIGAARDRYIDLAFFHAYLEIVAAAVLWAESGLRFTPAGAAEEELRVAPAGSSLALHG